MTKQNSPKNYRDFEDRKFEADTYTEKYFLGDDIKSGYEDYTTCRGIVRDQFAMIESAMQSRIDPERMTTLDVACAYGYSCGLMAEKGWKASGLDISEFAIKKAKEIHPDLKFKQVDYIKSAYDSSDKKDIRKEFGLITSTEFFEHVPTEDVSTIIKLMAKTADWGAFVMGATTGPGQDPAYLHDSDDGHLNAHPISWWIEQFAKFGELDFEAMFQFSKQAEQQHPEVNWHNRCIVVKFN